MPWDELPVDFPHLVLVRNERQYSVRYGDVSRLAGWPVALGGARLECLAFVERAWTDVRPPRLCRSIVEVPA